MSEILNLQIFPKDGENFYSLLASLGWKNCAEDLAFKLLQNQQPYTFLLIPGANSLEDMLLIFVDSKGEIKTKPIHIIAKQFPRKFINGGNQVYSNLKLLISKMMGCNISDLKPHF